MSNYTAVTGRLGDGKGLCTVGIICDYLKRGKPVITNMDIYPENFKDKHNKNIRIYRVPDYPCEYDVKMCGSGNDSYDPDENGLVALDEMATWFNSHDWNSKEAKELNKMFVHLRKMGYDGAFQIQSLDSLNTQLRKALINSNTQCKAVKEVYIPIISPLLRTIIGKQFKIPKHMRYHKVSKYEVEPNGALGMKQDQFRYRGIDYHALYDTKQMFEPDYPHGTFCYLTPWHLVGRYETRKRITLKDACNILLNPITILFELIARLSNDDLIKMGVLKKKPLEANCA